ncbi:putative hydrolase PNKD [Dissostichus eleginoides]|nr:putative hydrolase PNKD [Dissostichus eleginoides]
MPRRKAKNPMMPIGYAWMIGLPAGIIGFLLTKREVDKNRLKQLKVRQRMRMSNEGEYEGSRYRQHKEDLKQER